MNILEEIQNYPVEWKKLGEVCSINKGKQLNKNLLIDDGLYPAYNGGQTYSGRTNDYNVEANTIIVSQGGASAGFVNFVETKFWANAHCYYILPDETQVENRFVYHFLKMNQKYLMDFQYGAGIPALKSDKLTKLLIPVPPIKIQEKIVKKLDKMTNYTTELQTELQGRKQQYEYYRDYLLSEEQLQKRAEKLNSENTDSELKIVTLGEIGQFTRGNGLQKKDFMPKGKPVIHYGQIYTKFGFSTNKTISFVNKELFNKLKKAKPNSILIATTSENVEDVGKAVVWSGKEDVGFSGDMYSYETKENSRYIAYCMQTIPYQKQKERKATGTKVIRINRADMENFIIPLPSLPIQNRIVNVLDKFSSLLENTEGLLPKEIEQRQKQYEYYREKLLSFGEADPHTHTHTLISSEYFALLAKAEKDADIIPVEWKTLGEILDYKQPTKYIVKSKEYNNKFKTPVLTAGKTFILGFTNEEDNIFLASPRNPVIIFDDFTTSNRWIDFSFKVKSSAMKILYMNNTEENNVLFKYVYYYMQTINYNSKEHGRKWLSHYAKINIPIPPLQTQEKIVDILDKFNTITNDISEGLPKEIEQRQKQYEYYREKLLSFSRK